MKNEVVPTSAPHKMARDYFSTKQNFFHSSYAFFFHQKNFEISMTYGLIWKCWAQKKYA